jgi:transposase-like protein
MRDRGIDVDHSTIGHRVVKYSPQIIRKAMHKKMTVGKRWRIDETYIKIRGKDAYLFRAVDKAGNTVDFYVSENVTLKLLWLSLRRQLTKMGDLNW